MSLFLGFDTSCYTTSAAVVRDDGRIIANQRRLLPVPSGKQGMRQSEMVFHHLRALPEIFDRVLDEARRACDEPIAAICASDRPRDVKGSYMPAFTVGTGYARALASALRVPVFAASHQQGHIAAACYGSKLEQGRHPYLALHLSGGTTELLRCEGIPPIVELLGGTMDIALGQLVDRVGVMLGLPFPAGPHLEALAGQGAAKALPLSVRGTSFHLSGAEAELARRIKAGASPQDVAASVYDFAARLIAALIENGAGETRLTTVLLTGGVASSMRLRALLTFPEGIEPVWAKPELSGDNAVGAALIGAMHYHNQ